MSGYVRVIPSAGFSVEQIAGFDEAVAKWNSVIVSGAPPLVFPEGLNVESTTCLSPYVFQPGETLEGLLIFAMLGPLDGVGGTRAMASPCYMPSGQDFPRMGSMLFDVADAQNVVQSGIFSFLAMHEMGHAFGIGTLWQLRSFVDDACNLVISRPCDPRYNGKNGIEGYLALGPDVESIGNLPAVTDVGGFGTANMHWRESVFDNEVMTNSIDNGENFFSIMTIRALEDLGYVTNRNAADSYTIPTVANANLDEIELGADVMMIDFTKDFPTLPQKTDQLSSLDSIFCMMIFGFVVVAGLQLYIHKTTMKKITSA